MEAVFYLMHIKRAMNIVIYSKGSTIQSLVWICWEPCEIGVVLGVANITDIFFSPLV